ncbi:MAG: hypothetical protein EPO20_13590 [Betaproteobacteria bacterium]|nr:MAG: hypothetical protein EPO20_13590 [Betaproteobacteria bacterium]
MTQVALWLEWLFLFPGDTLIARIAPTPLGALLALGPRSLGSNTSAALSMAVWLVGIWALYGFGIFLVDAVDPTYRAERRERGLAEAAARRARMARERAIHRSRLYRRAWAWMVPSAVLVLLAALGMALVKDVL